MAQSPVFLERRSYRRRRLMDARRLLPMLALALWMIPLMWGLPGASDTAAPVPMSVALRYVFGIWCVTVLAGCALWWFLRDTKQAGLPDADAEGDPQQGSQA